MTDIAKSADTFLDWWDKVAFKRGFLAGFLFALGLVWLGK
jgi:hypothetical protein